MPTNHAIQAQRVAELEARVRELEIERDESLSRLRSERHEQVEIALRDSRERYRLLFENSLDAILISSPEGRIWEANPAACAMFGMTEAEIVRAGRDALVDLDDPRLHDFLRRRQVRGRVSGDFRGRRGDGSTFEAEVKSSLFQAQNGMVYSSMIIRDVTERILCSNLLEERNHLQLQQIVSLQEADRYKDDFLSVVSHELRTPLNFIMGFASILHDEVAGPLNESQRAYLTKVLDGTDRMLGLVNNLLDLSRMAAGAFALYPSVLSYATLVEDALASMQLLAAEKGIRLDRELPAQVEVWGDGQRLVQVITNLVDNAIKCTPPGGGIQVRVLLGDREIRTEVCDSGIGIAPENVPRLFQRFSQLDMSSTRKVPGTGLGLAIAKNLVMAHGGEIGVQSAGLGQGCAFWFTLPCRSPES